jgi:hypothetical protein
MLVQVTAALALAAAIPTYLLGGREAVAMMAIGAGAGLFIVLGGYATVHHALRSPERDLARFLVGGFLVRLVFLASSMVGLAVLARLDPTRFVLWLLAFYFVLLLAEAWALLRREETA